MNYLKAKLIITIFYISITFRDAYAGLQDENRDITIEDAEQKSSEQQTLFNKNCVERLAIVKRSRRKDYLDHYFDIFYNIYDQKGAEIYEGHIDTYVNDCLAKPFSMGENYEKDFDGKEVSAVMTPITEAVSDQNNTKTGEYLDKMLTCDILSKIYNLYPLDSKTTYCNTKKTNPLFDDADGFLTCRSQLDQLGFKFKNGLDNYVFIKHKLANYEKLHANKKLHELVAGYTNKTLTTIQQNYTTYLENEMIKHTQNNKNLSTTSWCNLWECESQLRDVGFKSRTDGKQNKLVVYSKYGGNCVEIKSEKTKNYCGYLNKNGINSTFTLLGTFHWCGL